MLFERIHLDGAMLVTLEKRVDDRGFFARTFCVDEFRDHGLATGIQQCNVSTNSVAGIMRGLHFQRPPHQESKIIRCTTGAIYDVIVDLRHGSTTYGEWFGVELSEDNGYALYVPGGFAHGYQALTDGATAFYMVDQSYHPESEGGLRFDDPEVGITWPLIPVSVTSKDKSWPVLADIEPLDLF